MMKKLFIGFFAAVALCSCNMDTLPEGSISDTDALTTAKDYEKFATGLHSTMRVVTSGDYAVLSDIQFDDFNAVLGNGNRRMEFYNGQVQPNTGEVASVYAGFYTVIAQTNFLIGNAEAKLKDDKLQGSSYDMVLRADGQAHFFRAYCYSALVDRFCQSYIHCEDRDKAGTGLSLQLTYSPTADNTKYPGRSSLAKTYEQIVSDLEVAISELETYESSTERKPVSDKQYATSSAAKALMARVCLNMGDYEKAIRYAEELIGQGGNGDYPLITNRNAFYRMWRNDEGSEIIWLVSGDYSYHGSATGGIFCNNEQNPDYVPTNDAIYLFEVDDTRWWAWFENDDNSNASAKLKTIQTSSGSADLFQFVKYPGNPALQDASASGSNYVNLMKPLRIGEMYLVAAEAYFMTNDEQRAKDYLSAIETARMAGRYNAGLTGSALLDEIRDERHRELMGEGLRQADLKRWNIGFTRSDAFEGNNQVLISAYRNISYTAGDYRLTWPIPQHEININPQMAGQQNPGYGK